jgi:murein DD-endopeptidase MepM/ murein hydrolase activator NlpD
MLEKSLIDIQSTTASCFLKCGAAQFFIFFVIASSFVSCSVNNSTLRTQIRQLQNGTRKEDTSYVYSLPFAIEESHRLVQGYFSPYSHKNRAALDFKMKKGTKIFAARNGVVVRVKKDGHRGGWNKKYRSEGNFIVIQHPDGSSAGYWHLQHDGAFIKVGDTVAQGQLIGLSGKTGYALFPHLHFLVWRHTATGNFVPTATRFKTSGGIGYLRPYRKYHYN